MAEHKLKNKNAIFILRNKKLQFLIRINIIDGGKFKKKVGYTVMVMGRIQA